MPGQRCRQCTSYQACLADTGISSTPRPLLMCARCTGGKDLLRRSGHVSVQHPTHPAWILIYGGVGYKGVYLNNLVVLDTQT